MMKAIDLSRPRWLVHVVLILTCIAASALLIRYLSALGNDGKPWPILAVVALLTWAFMASALRAFHSLLFQPRFILDETGIQLRSWRNSSKLWHILIPIRRAIDITIPWPDLLGTDVYECQSGLGASKQLNIHHVLGTASVDQSVFTLPPSQLAESISTYQNVHLNKTSRALSAYEEFQKSRFKTPIRSVHRFGPSSEKGLAIIFSLIGTVGLLYLGAAAFRAGILLYSLLGVSTFAGLVTAGWLLRRDRRPILESYFLECRADGLALGSNENSVTVIPWCEVLFCRFIERTVTRENATPILKYEYLELHLEGMRPIRVSAERDMPLEELRDLICPPLERLIRTRSLMSKCGLTLEEAIAAR